MFYNNQYQYNTRSSINIHETLSVIKFNNRSLAQHQLD